MRRLHLAPPFVVAEQRDSKTNVFGDAFHRRNDEQVFGRLRGTHLLVFFSYRGAVTVLGLLACAIVRAVSTYSFADSERVRTGSLLIFSTP